MYTKALRYLLITCAAALLSVRCAPPPPFDNEPYAMWPTDSMLMAVRSDTLRGRELMMANGLLGIRYVSEGNYDTARLYMNRAIAMPGGRSYHGGRLVTNVANSYAAQGRYAEALKYYLEALGESRDRMPGKGEWDQWGMNTLRTIAGIARMYYQMGDMEQALAYALRARSIDEVHGWNYMSPQYLYVIGAVHLDRGETAEARRAMELTLRVSDDICRTAVESSGDDQGMYLHMSRSHGGLARVALAEGDLAGALDHATSALDYAERNHNPAIAADAAQTLSDVYLARGDYAQSGLYARRALELFADYERQNPAVLLNLARTALHTDARDDADRYFTRYSARMKENGQRQFLETMAGMEVVYETERREERIASLVKQRNLYVAVGVVALLLAAAIWVLLRQNILSERRDKQLAAAAAILEWEKTEHKRFASDLHDGINGELAAMKLELGTARSMQHLRDRLDGCIETIRRMARGMMPGSLERYGLRAALEDYCRLFPGVDFHFFGLDERIGERLELTVYYCAYELVNNAFRHSGARHVDVQLVQREESVSVTVEDDGRGFDPAAVSAGSGLANIRDRVAVFG